MAFGKRYGGGGKSKPKGARLSGLFKTKRKGLYVGSINDEKLAELIEVIKKAKAAKKEVTLFLWKSTFEEGPAFSITADVSQDRDERKPKRRAIEEDDEDEAEVDDDGEAGDDPFADD